MSNAAQMAREEADRVEAEPVEPEPVEPEPVEPGPEPEPEPESAIGEAEIRKAERAIADQKGRLSKILGEAMVAHDCPLCSALGYLPELPPPGAVLEVVSAEEGVTFEIRAPGVPVELQDARDKGVCDWCDGYGQVRTHSKNPNAAIAPCSKCNGNGWVTVAADVPQQNYPPPTTATALAPPNGQPMDIPNDAWDRPYGHPHYGIPPSMVGTGGS